MEFSGVTVVNACRFVTFLAIGGLLPGYLPHGACSFIRFFDWLTKYSGLNLFSICDWSMGLCRDAFMCWAPLSSTTCTAEDDRRTVP
jgi:hypothetical protein